MNLVHISSCLSQLMVHNHAETHHWIPHDATINYIIENKSYTSFKEFENWYIFMQGKKLSYQQCSDVLSSDKLRENGMSFQRFRDCFSV
jgi:hypothetical protein